MKHFIHSLEWSSSLKYFTNEWHITNSKFSSSVMNCLTTIFSNKLLAMVWGVVDVEGLPVYLSSPSSVLPALKWAYNACSPNLSRIMLYISLALWIVSKIVEYLVSAMLAVPRQLSLLGSQIHYFMALFPSLFILLLLHGFIPWLAPCPSSCLP